MGPRTLSPARNAILDFSRSTIVCLTVWPEKQPLMNPDRKTTCFLTHPVKEQSLGLASSATIGEETGTLTLASRAFGLLPNITRTSLERMLGALPLSGKVTKSKCTTDCVNAQKTKAPKFQHTSSGFFAWPSGWSDLCQTRCEIQAFNGFLPASGQR